MRRDIAYWQRLRKDRRSNAAALLAALTCLTATISLISLTVGGTHYQSRGNPLYWLMMAPMLWWVIGLAGFEARYVRLWIPALVLASGVSIVAAAVAMHAAGSWTEQTIACAVTLAAAVASLLTYRGSLVDREGPAR